MQVLVNNWIWVRDTCFPHPPALLQDHEVLPKSKGRSPGTCRVAVATTSGVWDQLLPGHPGGVASWRNQLGALCLPGMRCTAELHPQPWWSLHSFQWRLMVESDVRGSEWMSVTCQTSTFAKGKLPEAVTWSQNHRGLFELCRWFS